MTIPVIKTKRLMLRGFDQNDLDAYATICESPDFMKFLSAGKPLTREQAWEQIEYIISHWSEYNYGLWAVVEQSTNKLIGRVGLQYSDDWKGIQIGWALSPQQWGKVYATEAAQAVIDWTFNNQIASELISLIIPENNKSLELAERLGLSYSHDMEYQGIKVFVYKTGGL
ncbi:GNAT family N-acetyltransferase [Endozoicomonas sp. SM1973]|uniref:GNAT family N-acetyltransferase n=1 Tax=Spartinivicinus marinus TaxID=2994442 RepID=A0A853HVU0_9GAMM|nr:GNAT family N-acetyltransferase [Spartinivicinus marinus]MCX4026695.1 GNAT family N-acetyltransferase [Spartinivicinus marinus]NYZ64529.1 GNAT family N-acetyltransferase [Spartinivicinus marinus]